MEHNQEIAYLATANDEIHAAVLESLLEAYEIPHLRKYVDSSLHMKTLFGGGARNLEIEIYVPASVHSQAVEILENKTDHEGE